jgi:hypothetical protein
MISGIYKRSEGPAPEEYQRLGDEVHGATMAMLEAFRAREHGDNAGDVGALMQGALSGVLEFVVAPMGPEVPTSLMRDKLLEVFNGLMNQTFEQRDEMHLRYAPCEGQA